MNLSLIPLSRRNVAASVVGAFLVLGAIAAAFYVPNAIARDVVTWEPNSIELILQPGESVSVLVALTTRRTLRDVIIEASPDIFGMVSVQPVGFPVLRPKTTESFLLHITAPTTPQATPLSGDLSLNRSHPIRGGVPIARASTLPISVQVSEEVTPVEGVTFPAPSDWNVTAVEGAAYLDSSTTAAFRLLPDIAHLPPDLSVAILPKPTNLSVESFGDSYDGGWFTHYPHRTALTVSGREAVQYSSLGAQPERAPVIATFIDLPPDRVVFVVLEPYESALPIDALDTMQSVIDSLTLD